MSDETLGGILFCSVWLGMGALGIMMLVQWRRDDLEHRRFMAEMDRESDPPEPPTIEKCLLDLKDRNK